MFIAMSAEMTNKIINQSVIKSSFGNFNPADIFESLNKFLNNMINYLLPFLILFAFFIAVGYVMFSHQKGWIRVVNALIGAIVALSSLGFLKTLYHEIDKNSTPNNFSKLLDAVLKYVKTLTEDIQVGIYVISFFVAALCVMFSQPSGWKRTVNATLGAILSFSAITIVKIIIKQFNTL